MPLCRSVRACMILRRERSLFPTVKSPFKWLPWCEGVRGRGGAVCPLSAFASCWWVVLSLLWTAILHILQLLQCGLKPNDFPKKKNPRLSLIDGTSQSSSSMSWAAIRVSGCPPCRWPLLDYLVYVACKCVQRVGCCMCSVSVQFFLKAMTTHYN